MFLSYIDNAAFSVVDIPVVLYALNFKFFICICPSFNILILFLFEGFQSIPLFSNLRQREWCLF